MFRIPDNTGAPPPQAPKNPDRPPSPKVEDYYGRMVAEKTANKPFLAHHQYKRQLEARRKEYEQRKKERAEKLARGEEVGPEERDPDEVREIGCGDLLKFLVFCIIAAVLASKFVTDTWTWGYEGKWTNIHTYMPSKSGVFSEDQLAMHDGTHPGKPIYIAIDHNVYDVSASPHTYGPGGSYHFMAGRDAARAYGTGCFQAHRTHDLRGLSESERRSVDHWKNFFETHKSYFKVGTVVHRPIDPKSPIPEPCKNEKKTDKGGTSAQPAYGPKRREEL